jgi:alkylhydroperoxidase family enzyme
MAVRLRTTRGRWRRDGVSRAQRDARAELRVQVDPTLGETLRKHLDPETLVQLTLSVAATNFTNRFNEALGTELECEEGRHG